MTDSNVVDLDILDMKQTSPAVVVTPLDDATALEKEVKGLWTHVKVNGSTLSFPNQKAWPLRAIRALAAVEDNFGNIFVWAQSVLTKEHFEKFLDLPVEKLEAVLAHVFKESGVSQGE